MPLLFFVACAARAPEPQADLEQLGPPEAQVRADLDCPRGRIAYTGGLGTPGQVLVRELRACGRSATYAWKEDVGWVREAP